MESNENLRGQHININNSQDVANWSRNLSCEPNDILQAVLRIGTCAKMVDDYLVLNRRKKTSHDK